MLQTFSCLYRTRQHRYVVCLFEPSWWGPGSSRHLGSQPPHMAFRPSRIERQRKSTKAASQYHQVAGQSPKSMSTLRHRPECCRLHQLTDSPSGPPSGSHLIAQAAGRRNNRTTNKAASTGSRGVGETQPWVRRLRWADPLEQRSAYAEDAAAHPAEPLIASALDPDGASTATWINSTIDNSFNVCLAAYSLTPFSRSLEVAQSLLPFYTPHPRCWVEPGRWCDTKAAFPMLRSKTTRDPWASVTRTGCSRVWCFVELWSFGLCFEDQSIGFTLSLFTLCHNLTESRFGDVWVNCRRLA